MQLAIRSVPVLAAGLALMFAGAISAQSSSFSTAPGGEAITFKPIATGGPGCGTVTLTQSASQAVTALNSVSCNAGGLHADNSYYRAFDLSGFPGGFSVCAVEFAIETATGAGGVQPVTVNVYANTGGVFPAGTQTLVGTQNISLANQSATIFNQPLAALVPAGSGQLVFEVFTPDGQAAGHTFFIGSNNGGETGPSFLEAAACAITTPTPTGAIGFPQMQIIMNVLGDPAGSALDIGDITELDVCAREPTNENGIIEPGERINFTIPLDAVGGDFTNVVGTLTSGTAGVTIVTGMGTYGNIADGDSASANFSIQLDETLACGSAIDLSLAVTSTEDDFSFPITRNVGQSADFTYNGLPAAIPDNNPAGVSVTADVGGVPGPITNVEVQVNATHTWVGDVTLRLTSPEGTVVTLLDRPGVPATTFGCNNENINVLFADGQPDPESVCGPAGTPWPVTDASPVPGDAMADFIGEDANGTWTLTAIDSAGGDTGTVVDWELFITPAAVGVCNVCPAGIDLPEAVSVPTLGVVALGGLVVLLGGLGLWMRRRMSVG